MFRTKTSDRQRGAVLVAFLCLAALLASLPATVAAPAAPTGGDGIEAPANLPSLDKRFEPVKNALRYRVFYSAKGMATWDNWTSADSLENAKTDAAQILKVSRDYTHAFLEDHFNGQILWRSW